MVQNRRDALIQVSPNTVLLGGQVDEGYVQWGAQLNAR